MCQVYHWNEVYPDGRFTPQIRHRECPNGSIVAPCRDCTHHRLHDMRMPRPGLTMDPNIQTVEPAQPAPKPSLKKKDKKEGLRLEWEFHVPFTSRDNKKKAQKETVVEQPVLPQQPYHPFFAQVPRPVYTPYPQLTPEAGPSNVQVYPIYPSIEPRYPPRRSYPTADANIIDVEPPRRSNSTHRERAPSPPARIHDRRPQRSQSVNISGRRHTGDSSHRRHDVRYERRYDSPPPTPRQHRQAREQEIQDRLSELERELQHTQRRAEIEAEISRRQEELGELRAGRGRARGNSQAPGRGRGQSQEPIFPQSRRQQTVVTHHQDGHETTRHPRGGRGASATRGGHNMWDSGVAIDDARRDFDDRGAQVLAAAGEDERRARLRGGWEHGSFGRRLLGASGTAAGGLRRNTERIIYEGDGRGGRSMFR